MSSHATSLRALDQARWRFATALTFVMIFLYFGFMLLIAFKKEWMGQTITPGLSIGVAMGAALILSCWLLIFIYVQWCNRVYDPEIARLRAEKKH